MDRVCPLLALADGRTVVDGVDDEHRCHAERPPAPLERQRQSQLCLTPSHDHCERFLAHLVRTRRASGGASAFADGLASTRMLLAPEPPWRGIAGRARRAPPVMGLLGAVAALGIAGVAVAGAMIDGAVSGEAAKSSATPSALASPSAFVPRSPSATARPTPTPTATPTPTPTPTPTSTPPPPPPATPPPPPPQQTYVVREGDTLAAIAQRFGTTVEAIQAANGIEDPNQIVVGDVLIIP